MKHIKEQSAILLLQEFLERTRVTPQKNQQIRRRLERNLEQLITYILRRKILEEKPGFQKISS